MQIQVNTDKNLVGGERLNEIVSAAIKNKLHRFGGHITRVEAHLSDENAHKSHGKDKKCVLEARPSGMQPLAVTHFADTVEQAIHGAVDKLERMLDSTFSQLHDAKTTPPPAIA